MATSKEFKRIIYLHVLEFKSKYNAKINILDSTKNKVLIRYSCNIDRDFILYINKSIGEFSSEASYSGLTECWFRDDSVKDNTREYFKVV
jgi:hypothetical protein